MEFKFSGAPLSHRTILHSDLCRDIAFIPSNSSNPISTWIKNQLIFPVIESSAANLLSLVDDLLRQFDEDGDEHLTMDEFSNVVADDLDDKWRQYMIEKNTFQRQEEFKRLIDKNHDGIADRSELLIYVSPKHPRHALQEAAVLFNIADRNKDQRLSFQEVCHKSAVKIRMKIIFKYFIFRWKMPVMSLWLPEW